MRTLHTAALLLFVAPAAGAQVKITTTPRAQNVYAFRTREDSDRPMLGVTTSAGDARDTLGLLVSDVTPGSPAEKAGIEEGNRLVSINGVSLKVAREDAGDPEMGSAMSNRLRREIGKHKAGDDVTVELLAAGKVKSVKVKLAMSSDIEKAARGDDSEHGVLGVSLSTSGSKRDTAGIFIAGVSDGSPADKAGIAEGDRIAAINGVDLRVAKEDAGDASVAGAKFQRLQRELRKVKVGQAVDLVVVSGGKSRTVKVATVKAGELKDWGGVNVRVGDGMMRVPGGGTGFVYERTPMPPVPPMPPHAPMAPMPPNAPNPRAPPRVRFFRNDGSTNDREIDVELIGPEIRRSIEREMPAAMERMHEKLRQLDIEMPDTMGRVREKLDKLQFEMPALRTRIVRRMVI